MRPLPKLSGALALLVLTLAGAWWWNIRDAKGEEGAYRTVEVESGDIRVTISATETLSAISTVVVGSQVSGRDRGAGRLQ